MAVSVVLTVSLVNASTVTVTVPGATSAQDAKDACYKIPWNKGIWADDNAFYPSTAILKITYAVTVS